MQDAALEEALRSRCGLERVEPLEHGAARRSELRVKPRETLNRGLPLRRGAVTKEGALEGGDALPQWRQEVNRL